MIRRLNQTALDKKYISTREYSAVPINADYKNLAVIKPWGSEYLLLDAPEAEIWNLSIECYKSTSTHCHPNKKTALIVLEGEAIFSSLHISWKLSPMDAVMIDAGVFHSTQGVSKNTLKLIEVETPPMKHDLLRLEDKYGRAQIGYEGADKMYTGICERLDPYDPGRCSKNICSSSINIRRFNSEKDLLSIKHNNNSLAIIIGGTINSHRSRISYGPAHVMSVEELYNGWTFNDALIMFISK